MFAALHLPGFLAAAAMRRHPEWQHLPCAVLAENETRTPHAEHLLLGALNPAARFAGLTTGWPLNRARVRCPDLRVLPRDLAAEAELYAQLIVLAESLAPDLELTAADAVVVDLACRPATAAWPELSIPGVDLWHARAATPDLAFLAARHPATHGRVVQPADLAALPLDVLAQFAASPATLELLENQWGLHTLGDFMALPRQALSERLGPEARCWHDLLHGKTCRLLRVHQPPEMLAQRLEFEEPLVSLEPLRFALKPLLTALSARLADRHLAAGGLDLTLYLTTEAQLTRRINLPEPQQADLWRPLQPWLENLQLDGAIEVLEVRVRTTFATSAQREWFGRQLPQPERWSETLNRLDELLGPARVGIPVPGISHAPDDFTLRPATTAPVPVVADVPARPTAALPLHRYRPPHAVAVAHELHAQHPRPLALLTGPYPGPILDLRGPYPFSGQWWDPAHAWQRLEWDVEVTGRQLVRLVYQPPDRWQLDGIYR